MNYKAHESTEKQVARDIVCNHFLSLKKGKVTCLSLPSTNFHFEKMLFGRSKSNLYIDCVERDQETFLEASKDPFVRNDKISLYRTDVFKFLDWTPNAAYDLIWLDLCAQMTVNLVQQVAKVVSSNKIHSKSFLAVTFMGCREHSDLLRLFQTENHEEIRKNKFPEFIINAARMADRVCKLEALHRYKNDNIKAATMYLYVFSLERL